MATTFVFEHANNVVRSPDEDVEFECEIPCERREILHQEGVIPGTAIREYLLHGRKSVLLLGIVTPDDELRLFTIEDFLGCLGLVEPHGHPRITQCGEPIDGEWKVHKLLWSEHVTRPIIQSDEELSYSPEIDEKERIENVDTLESNRQEAEDIADPDEERREILISNNFWSDALPAFAHAAAQIDVASD